MCTRSVYTHEHTEHVCTRSAYTYQHTEHMCTRSAHTHQSHANTSMPAAVPLYEAHTGLMLHACIQTQSWTKRSSRSSKSFLTRVNRALSRTLRPLVLLRSWILPRSWLSRSSRPSLGISSVRCVGRSASTIRVCCMHEACVLYLTHSWNLYDLFDICMKHVCFIWHTRKAHVMYLTYTWHIFDTFMNLMCYIRHMRHICCIEDVHVANAYLFRTGSDAYMTYLTHSWGSYAV